MKDIISEITTAAKIYLILFFSFPFWGFVFFFWIMGMLFKGPETSVYAVILASLLCGFLISNLVMFLLMYHTYNKSRKRGSNMARNKLTWFNPYHVGANRTKRKSSSTPGKTKVDTCKKTPKKMFLCSSRAWKSKKEYPETIQEWLNIFAKR